MVFLDFVLVSIHFVIVQATKESILTSSNSRQLVASETSSSTSTTDCCAYGNPQQLRFRYTGLDCQASANSQDPDLTSCTGSGSNSAELVFIRGSEDSKPCTDDVAWFDGLVDINNEFILNTQIRDKMKFASSTYIHIIDSESTCNTSVLETNLIDTSCLEPLQIGDIFGSAELVGCSWEDFTPAPTGVDCCAAGNNPLQMTFTYTGEGCYASLTAQSEKNDYSCQGVGSMREPRVYIMGTDDKNPCKSNAFVWFSGHVDINTDFTLSVANEPSEIEFNRNTYIHVLNATTDCNAAFERIHIKTSCTKPLYVGQVFGSAELIDCNQIYATPVPNAVAAPVAPNSSATPSSVPTGAPTAVPTSAPTVMPHASLTTAPTSIPTAVPTASPISIPTAAPSATPTGVPTSSPTVAPTATPSAVSTGAPTAVPTSGPTVMPHASPTTAPTSISTEVPTSSPAAVPTAYPTATPTSVPSAPPTGASTFSPTAAQNVPLSTIPSGAPRVLPTVAPTLMPSMYSTNAPTFTATTSSPTAVSTYELTATPIGPFTLSPVSQPESVQTSNPTNMPLLVTTKAPSSHTRSQYPTVGPSSTFAPTLEGKAIVTGSFILSGDITVRKVEDNVFLFSYALATIAGTDPSALDIIAVAENSRRRRLASLELTYTAQSSLSKVHRILAELAAMEAVDLKAALVLAQNIVETTLDISLVSVDAIASPSWMYDNAPASSPTHLLATSHPSIMPTLIPCERLDALQYPPVLKLASFDHTGANIELTFDVATDMAQYAVGRSFPCSFIIDFAGAGVSSCVWRSNQVLVADVSHATLLFPGDFVSVASENVVRRKCEDLTVERCDCFVSAVGNATIAPPSFTLHPKVILQGVSVAVACQGLEIDSSSSTGGGGRDFLDHVWNISAAFLHDTNSSIQVDSILTAAENRQRGDRQFVLTSDELTSVYHANVRELNVQLQITNFLGATATSEFTVILTSDHLPSLEVVGGLRQTVHRADSLAIRANAIGTSCDGRPMGLRTVEIDWMLLAQESDESTATTGLSSTSTNPRLFQLPAYSLVAGSIYSLIVTATDIMTNQTSQAICELVVEYSDVVAVLDGGQERSASIFDIITVSAAGSIDQDVESERGSAAGLTFTWNCSTRQNTDNNCSSLALIDEEWYKRESLVFNGSVLGSGTFEFHVKVMSRSDGRSDVASSSLKIVDDSPPSVAIVDFSSSVVSVESRLVLHSTSTPSSELDTLAALQSSAGVFFNTTWSLQLGELAGGLELDDWTTTKTSIAATTSHLAMSNQFQREHPLVFPPRSLVAGTTYALRLEANLEGIPTAGYAVISFTAAATPSGGILEVTPPAGVSLETSFTLVTRNWASDAFPLKYAFKVTDCEGITSILRTATSEFRLKDVTLPAGTPNVTVQVVAYDSIGSTATQGLSVRCEKVQDETKVINATQTLLENMLALNWNEGVYQVVVAAAQAGANNNSEFSSLLTNAVASVVAAQDSDISLIEQAAVAMTGVLTTSKIETDTRKTALEVYQKLAETSALIGITSTAAESIAKGLSTTLGIYSRTKSNSNSSVVRAIDVSLAALMQAQRLDLLPGEDALQIKTSNLRTAAARLAASSTDISVRQVALLDSQTSLIVPASLPGHDNYGVSLVEFNVNPFLSIDRGKESNGIVRIGIEVETASSYSRRILEDSSATAEVDLVFGPTISERVDASTLLPFKTNISCPCDYVGNVSVTCPSGHLMTRFCTGEPGIYNITCPQTVASCLTWEDMLEKWGTADCSASYSPDGSKIKCSCNVALGGTYNFGVSNAVLKSYAAYAANIIHGVDADRSLYMVICLGLVLLLSSCLAVYGAQLDRKDAALVADNPKPFISLMGKVTTIHGRHHIEVRSQKDFARTKSQDLKSEEAHPLFLDKRSNLRYIAALAHQHPLASWYFCYSPSASRVIRVVALGFEIVFFLFVLACEVNLIYADPGCSKQASRADCLSFKSAFWAGGADMCIWNDCECKAHTPAFTTAASNPHHYFVLALVLLITFPVLRAFEFVFQHYLIAPLPPELKRLRRWCTGGRAQHAIHIDEIMKAESDNSDEEETDIIYTSVERHQKQLYVTMWLSFALGRWRYRTIVQKKGSGHLSMRRVSNFVEKYVSNSAQNDTERDMAAELYQAYAQSVSTRQQTMTTRTQRLYHLPRLRKRVHRFIINGHKSKIEGSLLKTGASAETLFLCRQAQSMAPVAAIHILSQLEELHTHRVHYMSQGEARASELSAINRLSDHIQERWDWINNFDEWIHNVEDKIFDELLTAHKWRDELLALKMTFSDSTEMNLAMSRKLYELERVAQMSPSERSVWDSCMGRTDFVVVAPADSPSLFAYMLAWFGLLLVTLGIFYFLLSTSSELGRKQTALWLSHIAITGALTYLFIWPIEIFFFYVTVPNLLWERIMTRKPGTLKKFPFRSPQPPYALRFLLELEPSLSSSHDAARIVYGTVAEQRSAVDLSKELTSEELAEIVEYETWTPSPDTLAFLSFLGIYAGLPKYLQQVLFEEILSLSPYMSAILTKRALLSATENLPRRVVTALVIVVTVFLVFFSYGTMSLLRIIIRYFVRDARRKSSKKILHASSHAVQSSARMGGADACTTAAADVPKPFEQAADKDSSEKMLIHQNKRTLPVPTEKK